MRELTPLCLLARKYETDKGGQHYRYGGGDSSQCHNYTPIYWNLFGHRREQVKRVLEIGVNAGGSLRMWEEFFPNAEIVGIDIHHALLFNTDRIHCYQANQSYAHELVQAMKEAGPGEYDFMLDDGSHEYPHQITSMQTLVPYLADDGVYVVEDLQISCHPEIIGNHVPEGYWWAPVEAPGSLGRAHCSCPDCNGHGVEKLLLVRRNV